MIALWGVAAFASSALACPARTASALTEIVARTTGDTRTRAAACLLDRHPDRALPVVEGWMADPEARDLARLVIDRLEELPDSLAVAAARTGVRGPHGDWMTAAIWTSERAIVRAVLSYDDDI